MKKAITVKNRFGKMRRKSKRRKRARILKPTERKTRIKTKIELKIELDLEIEKEKESAAAEPPKQPRTAQSYKKSLAEAMQRGFENHKTLQARVESAFRITPDWNTKTNRAIMLWLKQRPKEETVEIFAEWWYSKDWRGKEKQPPNLSQMRELWPQAFKNGSEHRKDYTGGEFAYLINRDPDEVEKNRDDFHKSREEAEKKRKHENIP
jgi:hypothetical protein